MSISVGWSIQLLRIPLLPRASLVVVPAVIVSDVEIIFLVELAIKAVVIETSVYPIIGPAALVGAPKLISRNVVTGPWGTAASAIEGMAAAIALIQTALSGTISRPSATTTGFPRFS